MLDPSGLRIELANLAIGAAANSAGASITNTVVPVVPWSIARMRSDNGASEYPAQGIFGTEGRLLAPGTFMPPVALLTAHEAMMSVACCAI